MPPLVSFGDTNVDIIKFTCDNIQVTCAIVRAKTSSFLIVGSIREGDANGAVWDIVCKY